jgi:dTDP-4-dehydrorhamnose 3,5-epimerase-like enzyme
MDRSDQGLNPFLIDGGSYVDARGSISFVNDFDFCGIDRFYWVRATQRGVPRGWVGHRRERKWFAVLQGEVLIAVVAPDDWQSPRSDLPVTRYHLKSTNPQVLHIPPGYATANLTLTPDALLLIFSSGKLEDIKTDDYRFPVDQWPIRASE